MNLDILLIIFGAALVTYLPRLLPILAFKNAQLPEWFQKWMTYLPISIFASLIATDIFFWDNQLTFNPLTNVKILPSVVAAIVAYKTKSMIYSIVAGVIAIALFIWLS